jgi:hypothetical protein
MNIRDFVKGIDSDKGAVIITEKKADVNTVIRSMNRYGGAGIVGLRVLTVSDAAYELVCAYAALTGESTGKKIVYAGRDLCTSIMYKLLCEEKPDFLPLTSVCLETAAEILRVMDMIRCNDATDEYKNASAAKVKELKDLISKYENRLEKEGFLDDAMLFDKALDVFDKIGSGNENCDIRFILPWTKLDVRIAGLHKNEDGADSLVSKKKRFLELLFKLSDPSINDIESRIIDLSAGDAFKPAYTFFKGYGSVNEVRHVARSIIDKNLDFGNVAIVYAGDAYENILRGELDNAGIPYTFTSGIHGTADSYISFILELLEFAKEDYSYEVLGKAVHNRIFNLPGKVRSYASLLYYGIGWGRDRYYDFYDRYDKEDREWAAEEHDSRQTDSHNKKKKFVEFLKKLTDAFEADTPSQLLTDLLALMKDNVYSGEEYSEYIRPRLTDIAKSLNSAGINDDPVDFLIEYLGRITIPVSADPGKVEILSYTGCKVFDRENVFCVGFSRENVEKNISESPVLSDKEIHMYADGFIEDAKGRNKRARENFLECLKDSSVKEAVFGYSYYDTIEFLENEPSFLYSDLMGEDGEPESFTYEDVWNITGGDIKFSSDAFKESWKKIEDETEEETEAEDSKQQDNTDTAADADAAETDESAGTRTSSTGVHNMLKCPLRYHYKSHLYIPEEEHTERNGHFWLKPNNKGNLFHYTLDDYCKGSLIENELEETDENALKVCFEDAVKRVVQEIPYPNEDVYEKEKNESYEVIKGYIDRLHRDLKGTGVKVLACEAKFDEVIYEGGSDEDKNKFKLVFNGSADRVDGKMEGSTLLLYIVDYKTGKKSNLSKKIQNDHQIQHFVYCAGAVKWANENLDALSKRFGCEIESVKVADMRYELPFEGEDETDIIPAGDKIDATDKELRDGKLAFPESVIKCLQNTEGVWQSDRENAFKKIKTYTEERLTAKEQAEGDCIYCDFAGICRIRLEKMQGGK